MKETERIALCLYYIYHTKDITYKKLKQVFEESKIDGGDLMPSLAQRLRDEGKEIGKENGIKEEKERVARELIKNGVDLDIVVKATGYAREALEKFAETVH